MHPAGDREIPQRETRTGVSVAERARRLRRRMRAWRWPTRDQAADWLAEEFETEAKARSAFFLVPIGLMIGIAMTDGAGWRTGLGPVLVVALPLLVAARHLGGRGIAGASVLLATFVALGMALALIEIGWTTTTIFSGEATVRIDGRVLWRDRDERERMRYLVRIERTERPVLSRPPERVSILVSSRHEPIPVGGRFQGLVRLRAPSGPAYPGAYDFAFAPFFEGRGANGFSLGAPEPPGNAAIEPTLGERLVTVRLAMSDRIREVVGGGAGAVAAALITGERSGIPDDINDWLRATGLSHVLSISGLHMALVAGFAMVLVRGLLASIPGAALTLPTKKIAAVAALIVATGYLVISGSDVATDRSYVMLSIMLVAILVDRPALTLRNVAIAAIVVMLTTPHAVVTASFQMSFSATAGLVGVYGAISRRRAKRSGHGAHRQPILAVLLFLAGLAASSAIAGTATAPYAAYHFQRIAPYGVIANLIAVPIFSFWIMPLALIAALAMPFGLDAPFLILIGWALDLVFEMARILATHLPDAPSGRLTTTGLLVLTAALLFACLPAGRLRWLAAPIGLIGLLLLPDRSPPPELLVYEDGRELALIDAAGRLHPLRPRPNDFVLDQWTRAFATGASAAEPSVHRKSDATSPSDAASPATGAETASGRAPPGGPADTVQTTGDTPRIPNAVPIEPNAAGRITEPLDRSVAFACKTSPLPPEGSDAVTAGEGPPAPSRTPSASLNGESGASGAPVPGGFPTETAMQFEPDGVTEKKPTVPGRNSTMDPMNQAGSRLEKPDATAMSSKKPRPPRQICRATTRSGLRIAWTDDYRLTGQVCDSADVAIVARAVARRTCRSGARIVTLRSLRQTGSLAVSRDPIDGSAQIDMSITDPDAPWNRHRRAAWPEAWRNPDRLSPQDDQRKTNASAP